LKAFGSQERTLQFEVAPESAELARGGDDTVTRHIAPTAVAHDIADRARGTRPSRSLRNIAISGNAADRNAPDDGEDRVSEFRRHG
jgi:hypothetical protein